MGLSGTQRGSPASLLAPLLQGNGERAASSARFNYAPACFIKSYAEGLCFVSFVTHTVTGTWTSWCIQVHHGKSILEWQLRMSRTGTFVFFSSCPLLTNKSLSLSFYVFVLSLHFLEFDACNHESIYLISPLILSANRSPTSSGILVKNFLIIIKI